MYIIPHRISARGRQQPRKQCEAIGSACKPSKVWEIICERLHGTGEKVAEFSHVNCFQPESGVSWFLIPYFAHLSGAFMFEATILAYREFGFCLIWVTFPSAVRSPRDGMTNPCYSAYYDI